MKILITSGGTVERIDAVRSIVNDATGMLGSLIAKEFSRQSETETIYYVCGKNAITPASKKTKIIPVDNTVNLEATIRKVLEDECLDIIVHAMAVSDYRVKGITSASLLASSIRSHPTPNADVTEELITSLLEASQTGISGSSKIRSSIENMALLMEQTPKIISLFQSLSPNAVLIGFKLLDHVPHDTLIDTAYHILNENKCRFVLANDKKDINRDRHIGYLVDKNKNYTRYKTKLQIAKAIVTASIAERRTGK